MHKILFLLALATCAQAHATDLTIRFEGAQPGDGQVMAALFSSDKQFQKMQPLDASSGQADQTLVFHDLPAGRYMVAAFQDRNGNQQLDFDPQGMPQEPFGFSSETGAPSGPSFASAGFTLSQEPREIHISLISMQ